MPIAHSEDIRIPTNVQGYIPFAPTILPHLDYDGFHHGFSVQGEPIANVFAMLNLSGGDYLPIGQIIPLAHVTDKGENASAIIHNIRPINDDPNQGLVVDYQVI